jgi:hydroxyethylthiazole kinase-like uncharacterized protein yjeF
MITDSEGMRKVEKSSGLSTARLMEKAGAAVFDALTKEMTPDTQVLVLCGKGNNGGDGFVLARLLAAAGYAVSVYACEGTPVSKEALAAYHKLPAGCLLKKQKIDAALEGADVIVDAVYGYGYHGALSKEDTQLFAKVNASGRDVFSIDINSGCEADTGRYDRDAIRSRITYAMDCWKPFHLLRKDHGMFEKTEVLSLDLPHADTRFHEMNEDLFFRNFPKKKEDAYKGTYGKTLLIGGCYGMAGAVCLNILGAKTVGAPYINVALPEEIYAPAAAHFITPVFHPFGHETMHEVVEPLISSAAAIGFGSGAVYMDHKEDCLDLILQTSRCPVVLDAEALRMLKQNTYILKFVKAPVILTPHIAEFADIVNQPLEVVQDNKMEIVRKFAADYKVILVLKGPNTIVVSPSGDCYINQSGNQALAQAGSGDVLTGIMSAMLSMTRDVFTAVIMAVWLHGYLADLGIETHSIQGFSLDAYPHLMDQLFRKHGL